jgi:hypothetical protein
MADLENFAIGLSQGLVLSPADYQTMWTPYSLPGGTPGTFGLGWAVHQSSTGAKWRRLGLELGRRLRASQRRVRQRASRKRLRLDEL